MRTNNIYSQNCPTHEDFEKYLNQSGHLNFIKEFEHHLNHCELCNTAIEGYKTNHFKNPASIKTAQMPIATKQYKTWLSIAAVGLILIAAGFYLGNLTQNMEQNYYALNEIPLYTSDVKNSSGQRTLMHKTQNEFWTLSKNNQLKINDQLISGEDDIHAILIQLPKNTQTIYLEVESNQSDYARNLIETIQHQTKIKVYPYSSQKRIKKTNLRR